MVENFDEIPLANLHIVFLFRKAFQLPSRLHILVVFLDLGSQTIWDRLVLFSCSGAVPGTGY